MAGLIPLANAAVVSNRGADFTLTSLRGTVPAALQGLAQRWLGALLQHNDNIRLTVLQREGESWWLMHVRREGMEDEYGRSKAAALIGQLPDEPDACSVPALLKNHADACRKGREVPAAVSAEPMVRPALTGSVEVVRAMLALALGYNATAKSDAALALILDRERGLSLSAVGWIALLSGTLPDRLPPGPGLFLSDKSIRLPAGVDSCFDRPPEEILRLRLGELARLPDSTDDKTALLKRVLGMSRAGLSEEAIEKPYTLGGLAWAAQSGEPMSLAAFKEKLIGEGLPPILAGALLEDGDLAGSVRVGEPKLKPAWSWLRVIAPLRFLNCSGSVSRDWWLAGLKVLMAEGGIEQIDLLLKAIETRDLELLQLLEASEILQSLAKPNGERVRIPPEADDWPQAGSLLIEMLYDEGELWGRIEPPLTLAGMNWLEEQLEGSSDHRQVQSRFSRLRKGEAISASSLLELAPLLAGDMVLRQVARLGRTPWSGSRQGQLAALLHPGCLCQEKLTWLRARVLTCAELPALPAWTARELLLLLPIIDPIDHVVRIILGREDVDPEGESELLPCLLERLTRVKPIVPVPAPDEVQRARRPEWFATLAPVLGWETASASRTPDWFPSSSLD